MKKDVQRLKYFINEKYIILYSQIYDVVKHHLPLHTSFMDGKYTKINLSCPFKEFEEKTHLEFGVPVERKSFSKLGGENPFCNQCVNKINCIFANNDMDLGYIPNLYSLADIEKILINLKFKKDSNLIIEFFEYLEEKGMEEEATINNSSHLLLGLAPTIIVGGVLNIIERLKR